jgi:hypothetical protein
MESYSYPPQFDAIMALATRLPVIDCVAIAAKCGVIYGRALTSSLTHYDIVEAVFSEGDFAQFCDLVAKAAQGDDALG